MGKKKTINLIIILSCCGAYYGWKCRICRISVYRIASDWDKLIYPNIKVMDVNIGGKTEEELGITKGKVPR